MSAEYPESQPEEPAQTEPRKPTSELWGPWYVPGASRVAGRNENDQRAVSGMQFRRPGESAPPPSPQPPPSPVAGNDGIDPQAAYREHVSGPLNSLVPPTPAALPAIPHSAYPLPQAGYPPAAPPGTAGYPPLQSYPPPGQGYPPAPSYPGMAGYPSYQGYTSGPPSLQGYQPGFGTYNGYPNAAYPGYPGYPPYAMPYPPPRPRRDGYLYGIGITSLIGSSLVLLGGLVALLLLSIFSAVPNSQLSSSEQFSATVTLLAFGLIGLIGGGYGLYHSIRSVFLRRPSADFKMPTFWLFVALYIVALGAAYALHVQGQDTTYVPLTVFLILMAGLLPALAVLALGDRGLRFPKKGAWPTSWRRFTLAIVSGATLGVLVAGLLEFLFEVVLARGQGVNPFVCLTNPGAPQCQNPQIYNLLLITVAIVAPLVEEAVKPLAAVILIGRVRSAAEAFVLGLSCGIGFDLIETSGYISSSYPDWLSTALIRTGAGLLHGLGAAMVVLGWYFLTHPGKNRVSKALGCWLYAVVQHAVWNGSWGLALLPGATGQFFNSTLALGSLTLPYYYVVNVAEAVFMFCFFLYMTHRLRNRPAEATAATTG